MTTSVDGAAKESGRERRAAGRRGPWRLAALAVLLLIGLLAVGIVPRIQRRTELAESVRAATASLPVVTLVSPAPAPRESEVVLPGNIQAIQETAIYSRVEGYLKKRFADIGDRVEAGQVLAEIDTPDLDQQLAQARATLAQAEASLAQARSAQQQARATLQHNRTTSEYNRTNLARWRSLRAQNLVAQQDVDDRQVAVDASEADVQAALANVEALQASIVAAQANVDANRANVQRLLELQSYQRVRAPFAGVITVRNVDGGALITAGSSSTNTPMFRIAQTENLRIFVNVPQTFMNSLAPGMTVHLLVRELPRRTFTGRVVSASGALDPASRTLLTELRMANEDGALRPGMYAEVRFRIEREHPPLLIPSSALIIRSGAPQVALVKPDRTVKFQPVEIGRDYGSTVEIIHGLVAEDSLVATPPDGLREGGGVQVVPAPAGPPRGAAPEKRAR
ncbi:MAG TPA: efflux RND transporter periplasmic adaptor subunit [Candidatus Methylomirabilis sp.]|nr:efflux RND transporter periplasmic adaptor subunit [Candidatus Methylomirabilis sp.]